MPTEHFKSKEAYRKWTAYRHMHGIPAPHLKTAVIAGTPHKVKHNSVFKRKKKNEGSSESLWRRNK